MAVFRKHEPDFNEFVKVLKREKTSRPVLFELLMNYGYLEYFAEKSADNIQWSSADHAKFAVQSYYNAGFDYVSVLASEFDFPTKSHETKSSISLNDSALISDRESFENYPWVNPNTCDYSRLSEINEILPSGMKAIVFGPIGVLEAVIRIVGYENLCYMLYEDEELVSDIFDKVGSSLLDYYINSLNYDCVGAIISDDDWGFNTQTFLSVEQMKKYVFPWHKKIVEEAHKRGKYAILHSCGYMNEVFDYIINDMKYDGKHSFEDNIYSVEKSFEQWGDKIAILGGLDIDYLVRASEQEVEERAKKLAKLCIEKGGYALGTGNSLCDYIPKNKVDIMLNIANGSIV